MKFLMNRKRVNYLLSTIKFMRNHQLCAKLCTHKLNSTTTITAENYFCPSHGTSAWENYTVNGNEILKKILSVFMQGWDYNSICSSKWVKKQHNIRLLQWVLFCPHLWQVWRWQESDPSVLEVYHSLDIAQSHPNHINTSVHQSSLSMHIVQWNITIWPRSNRQKTGTSSDEFFQAQSVNCTSNNNWSLKHKTKTHAPETSPEISFGETQSPNHPPRQTPSLFHDPWTSVLHTEE